MSMPTVRHAVALVGATAWFVASLVWPWVASATEETQDGSVVAEAPHGVEGLLRVHPYNQRYLTNDTGEAVLLGGSHTWSTFQDYRGDRPFPYSSWLSDLESWGHNFFRGWHWEDSYYEPVAYLSAGSGTYHLDRFNPAWMARLRQRLEQANERGFYVSVMLFQGWSVDRKNGLRQPDPWPEHPFAPGKEANGLGLDGQAREALHTLGDRRVTDLQKLYVEYVVQELNDLDNIFWEISNESHEGSIAWQSEMVAHIRSVESELPKQHLVWVSCAAYGGVLEVVNTVLFESAADIISPCRGKADRYVTNPPASSGDKVVLADTDHLSPERVSVEQVWRSFMRGMHPVFMDWYTPLSWWTGSRLPDARLQSIRQSVGSMRRLASLEDLAHMAPQAASATYPVSSGYALYSSQDVTARVPRFDQRSVLAYLPTGEQGITVCGLASRSAYDYTWFDAVSGARVASGNATPRSECIVLDASALVGGRGTHGLSVHLRMGSSNASSSETSQAQSSGQSSRRSTSGGGVDDGAAYDWTDREDNPGQHDSATDDPDSDGGL